MSFGMEVFDADGSSIFSIGYKYMYPMGEVHVPENRWLVSDPSSADWSPAEGVFIPNSPQGERVWVLATLGSSKRPEILEFRQDQGHVFYRRQLFQLFISRGVYERIGYGFSFQWGIYA